MQNRQIFTIPLFFVFVVGAIFTQCTPNIRDKKPIFKTSEFVFYRLPTEALEPEELQPVGLQHPYNDLKTKDLTNFFQDLKFRKDSSVGNMISYILSDSELESVMRDLPSALATIKSNEVLLVVTRFQPFQSVISPYERNVYCIWIDAAGLNVVFSELHKDINSSEANNYFEWSKISEFSLKRTGDNDFLLESPQYKFKMVEGFPNRRWITIPISDLHRVRSDRFQEKEKRKNATSLKELE